jgi:predicted metal-binding protein
MNTVLICELCRQQTYSDSVEPTLDNGQPVSDGQQLLTQMEHAIAQHEWGDRLQIRPVRCMAVCDRACAVAFAAPNKLTYVFSGLSAASSVADLVQFAEQYIHAEDGRVPYKQRPEQLKKGVVTVLPALAQTYPG